MAKAGLHRATRTFEELFHAPPPPDQPICDVFAFSLGKFTFVLVTGLCLDREKPALARLFRLESTPPYLFDPEPVLTLSLFHPRNIALSPERDRARWMWIADHGPDHPPFPGGHSPLFRIHESGLVERRDDPLLARPEFSFDGALWESPGGHELYLYQCNTGVSSPRLLRWQGAEGGAMDLSERLPRPLLEKQERYLVSKVVKTDVLGVELFLGADYSCRSAPCLERDLILRIPFEGPARPARHALPPRLKDRTWSTVEALPMQRSPGGPDSLLAIYHDLGFTEGTAEVLDFAGGRLKRSRARLPLPSLAGERTWIARAAVGDFDGDGRKDIVLYLRSTDGAFPLSRNNLFLLRQNAAGRFEYALCQDTGSEAHFPGGFFVGDQLIQVRCDGRFQRTWFSF
jgi:hypothetical protein